MSDLCNDLWSVFSDKPGSCGLWSRQADGKESREQSLSITNLINHCGDSLAYRKMARKICSTYNRSQLSFISPCELNMQMARPLKSQTYSWSFHFTFSFCSVIFLLPNQTSLTSSNAEPYSIRPLFVFVSLIIHAYSYPVHGRRSFCLFAGCEIASPSNPLPSPPSRPIKRHERGTDLTWVE